MPALALRAAPRVQVSGHILRVDFSNKRNACGRRVLPRCCMGHGSGWGRLHALGHSSAVVARFRRATVKFYFLAPRGVVLYFLKRVGKSGVYIRHERRTHYPQQCAKAATARLQTPQVNLLELGDSGEATRHAKCLEAAMIRFVLGNETSQPQPRGRGTKRKAHTALLRELVTQWGGTEGFNPLLCGPGRSLKHCAREPWETNNA